MSFFLLVSCEKKCVTFTAEERKAADSIVKSVAGVDSLSLLQKRLEKKGDKLGSIVALREWGKMLRGESRFEEALSVHSKGQQQAEAIGDTLELVMALNNIGTDYRRMGVLDLAQDYHYRAWMLCKECTDTSYVARKNRVVSLNGLGNVYMTLGNFERADSVLRLALAGEQRLNSAVGQAINYANLGSIFERHGKTDSAWAYYRKSMALNKEAENELGIALCHTNFGSLYEKARQYDKATEEYEAAYQMMKASKDEWHALNTLIALAGIYHVTGNNAKKMEYLSNAKAMAERIKSPEHLADIHTLYYKHYMQTGDYRSALASYEKATVLQDSVLNIEKVNRIQNTSLNIERNRQVREMDAAKQTLEEERVARKVGFAILGFALLILIGALVIFLYLQRIHRRNHLELKKMAAMRENFFTNITHEFRTPLTVILGLSRDLQEVDSVETKEKAQVIERQGKGLLALINQLLDISKVKSAVGRPDWKNGNIVAFLTMIVEGYHDYARSHNIDLQMFAEGEIVMDFIPDYVVKVMNNLLSNSFKFTPAYGKIRILVKRVDEQLHIAVSDTGKGISKETLQHVFEPFYQDENNTQHVGSGVGLALVEQIIRAVNGSITVDSELGKGTTFHISLPVSNRCQQKVSLEAEKNTPVLPETAVELTDSSSEDNDCRLLIIEDNRDIAAYIGSQFAGSYAVSYAENGKDGLEKALELVPDLIITDLMMPGMDGLEVCRQVRANEIINHIPIIIVTAKITEEERIRGIEAGADAYLSKPFNADELRTRVEKLLEGRKLLQAKFATLPAELKKTEEQEDNAPKDVDLRFLARLSSIVYMLLSSNKDVDVTNIASHMCMSSRQFYRKVNALTGYTPSAYILRLRIKRAKTLLANSPQLSLGEVADKCGFTDYSNFVRAFKNVCGVIPTDYRREHCP
ncbi:MAG: hybrid sensor histidine kinase/response regulator transcription factor [Prevotella fusca]|uniref:hybrid sensor histidine kinase/response regulator transcription factor n=1 Tax=Prevotella fusca TaxID=589436 RepID=UPI003FA124EC